MNIDHFSFIQAPSSRATPLPKRRKFGALRSGSSIVDELRDIFSALPSKKKTKLRDFSVVHVNPSVIPTYLPAVRVWQYNTSVETRWRQPVDAEVWRVNGSRAEVSEEEEDWDEDGEEEEDDDEEDAHLSPSRLPTFLAPLAAPISLASSTLLSLLLPTHPLTTHLSSYLSSLSNSKKKKKKKKHPRAPRLPRHFSPLSPSMTNRFLTPLGYTQFYLELDEANRNAGHGRFAFPPSSLRPPLPPWEVEYLTFDAEVMARGLLGLGPQEGAVPAGTMSEAISALVREERDGETVGERVARVRDALEGERLCPYGAKDLTVGSWVKEARKLGKSRKKWKAFVRRMFVGSGVTG